MWKFFISTVLLTATVSAQSDKNHCFLGRQVGDSSCGGSAARSFYYHKQTRTCQPFYYQGCNGNANRFASKSECESECKGATASGDMSYATCASGAYAAGATSDQKLSCDQCPDGYKCENEQCCPTKEHTCSLQYDAGKFGTNAKHTPRYFYSKSYKNCMLFTYYGRDGNANNFATFNECKNFCMG